MWRNGRRNGLKIRFRSRGVRVRVPPSVNAAASAERFPLSAPSIDLHSWSDVDACSLVSENTKMDQKLLSIPVILGTTRQGRRSAHAAGFVLAQTQKRAGVEADLIDVRSLPLRLDDAGEQIKIPAFSEAMRRSDALILVVPEYNHGYPGLLKHALDTNLEEYIHKAVGICGVSAGPFGGTRVIEQLLPVMRELGLVTIFTDVNFSQVEKLFGENGELLDDSFFRRVDAFLDELIWMARVLRQGRENVARV